jgi:hypothetical protein
MKSFEQSISLELITQFNDCNTKKLSQKDWLKKYILSYKIRVSEILMCEDHLDVQRKKEYLSLMRKMLNFLERRI